jgi:hypothetical protein
MQYIAQRDGGQFCHFFFRSAVLLTLVCRGWSVCWNGTALYTVSSRSSDIVLPTFGVTVFACAARRVTCAGWLGACTSSSSSGSSGTAPTGAYPTAASASTVHFSGWAVRALGPRCVAARSLKLKRWLLNFRTELVTHAGQPKATVNKALYEVCACGVYV